MTYLDWCQLHGCTHGHCQLDCEHPQPFALADYLYCGRCWFMAGVLTEMVPCRPENCGEQPMNAFQLRQLTIPLTIRSEVLFELEDGTRLEAVSYRPARQGHTQDVVLVLRPAQSAAKESR